MHSATFAAGSFFSPHARPATISAKNSLNVEIAGLYWHFVDIVWIIIFTVVYLLQPANPVAH